MSKHSRGWTPPIITADRLSEPRSTTGFWGKHARLTLGDTCPVSIVNPYLILNKQRTVSQ